MLTNQLKLFAIISTAALICCCNGPGKPIQQHNLSETKPTTVVKDVWKAPEEHTIPKNSKGEMIRYGKDLIVNTSAYFGPKGRLGKFTNGLNCQNCHLDAGTRIFGNNYAAVMSSYPKITARSGKIISPAARIKGCFERSLNGTMPDSTSKEIRAMLTYMEWLNQGVKEPEGMYGRGTEKIAVLDRPADPKKGALLYSSKCRSCHGENGEGIAAAGGKTFVYPPLWGKLSYNDGAGLYRLSNFAGFIKNNMPFGASYKNPILTDEESWDIAAFVNSQARPHKDQHKDYPDLKKKPVDAPYGPYGDQFSEKQHKYGPYQPIKNAHKTKT